LNYNIMFIGLVTGSDAKERIYICFIITIFFLVAFQICKKLTVYWKR